jgi:hypothetical protein
MLRMAGDMRVWALMSGLTVAGCGPSFQEQAVMHAENEEAIKRITEDDRTPVKRMQDCLDIEIRSIIVTPVAANPPRAADIVMSDCQPHAEVITRNMPLQEVVQYNNRVRADVIAQIIAATR